MPENTFLTPDELVARYKGNISVKTLANWRTKGGGPRYVKIGGKIMYALAAVLEWENARTYGSTAMRVMNDALRRASALFPFALSCPMLI